LKAYGLPAGTRPAEYDHLIPRWAGGTSDERNIWPATDATEARRKDALELALFNAYCRDHTISLSETRFRAAHFWAFWPAAETTTTTRKGTP
jgi:hypothetical protein